MLRVSLVPGLPPQSVSPLQLGFQRHGSEIPPHSARVWIPRISLFSPSGFVISIFPNPRTYLERRTRSNVPSIAPSSFGLLPASLGYMTLTHLRPFFFIPSPLSSVFFPTSTPSTVPPALRSYRWFPLFQLTNSSFFSLILVH